MSEINNAWAWLWWVFMVAINIIQLIICFYFVFIIRKRLNNQRDTYSKWMMIFGVIFTIVAAYRSVFVSRYLTQYAWFDTIANSSLIIRSLALLAEISFAFLFGLYLLNVEKDVPVQSTTGLFYRLMTKGPYFLIIAIILAQFFAYGGLIFKSRLSFAIEESLWSLGFFAILPIALVQLKRLWPMKSPEFKTLRIVSMVVAIWCIIYCTYALVFHLPTEYWAKAFEQMRTNIPELKSGWSAVSDSFYKVNVTHRFSDWGIGFFIWHSSYFTICVWLSLMLMRAPRKKIT